MTRSGPHAAPPRGGPAARRRRRAARRLPGPPCRHDELGLLIVLQGLRCIAQGQHDQARDERSQPQGVAVRSFKRPSRRTSSTISSGATRQRCPARAGLASSRSRTTRRLLAGLSAGLHRHAVRDQHAVGAVVRGPRRPQVVQPPRHGRGRGAEAQGHQPGLPRGRLCGRGQMAEVRAELMAELTGRPAPRAPGAAAGPDPARRGRRPVPRSGA